MYGVKHTVLISIEHHSVCPLVGIGNPPTPIPQASVPYPRTKGWGAHSPAAEGVWGSPNSDDWRKSLALCLLCGVKALLKSVSTHLKNATSILDPFLPLVADLTVL